MSTNHTLSISKNDGYGHRVLLDGTDIANGIDGLNITMRAGQPSAVEISFPVIDVTEIQDPESRVLISDHTRDALIALGWTPPEEQPQPGPVVEEPDHGTITVQLGEPAPDPEPAP